MPNYLFLFRGGQMRTMSPQQLQESMGRWGAWMGELSKKGQLKAGEPLADEGRLLTGKKQTVTDGPFGETKDVVGGYLLITASNLDAATEAARGCPIFERDGSVEVREIREMQM
jgi:hypothetical protein